MNFIILFKDPFRLLYMNLINLKKLHFKGRRTAKEEADYRLAINPKHPAPDADFNPKPYYQVYSAKHGFLPNLSVLDLLFNMGPESVFYL